MTPTSTISNSYWYSFIVISGATSIAVEIVGMRFLAPLFGSSLPVWGLAIATVLAGLAWGYTQGGRQADVPHTLQLVFQFGALASALFLWMPVLFLLATSLRNAYFAQSQTLYIGASFFLAFATLLIPSVIFGFVSPLAVQAEAQRCQQPAGRVAGRISTLMTIGSLLGILIPSFITIPVFGSHITVWILAGTTLTLSTKVLWDQPKIARSIVILALSGILITVLLRHSNPSIIFAQETQHQLVQVHEVNNERLLTFDANLGTQSVMTHDVYTRGYWDYLASLPLLLPSKPTPISVVVLGAAASTTERQMERFWSGTKTFHFTSVEIDKELFKIANTYFDPPDRQAVVADARLFVAADSHLYDLVIIDTYTRELTVPFHLTTTEFFASLKKRVAPTGLVAININTTSPNTLWMRSIARTVHDTFPHVQIVPIPNSCNYLLLASAQPISLPSTTQDIPPSIIPLLTSFQKAHEPRRDGLKLTDDHSPTDFLGFAALMLSPDQSYCTSE